MTITKSLMGALLALVLSLVAACLFDPVGRGATESDGDADGDSDADGDECVPSPERCNGVDDDCDGAVDEEPGADEGVEHCGACGNVCPTPPRATPTCVAGECGFECESGWRDCDGDGTNGCETDLSSPAHCGACDGVCPASAPFCQEAREGVWRCDSSCADGEVLCSGTCVDPETDPRHCGGCGADCGNPVGGHMICEARSCVLVCDEGRGNCDDLPGNGCEDSLDTIERCGSCTNLCSAPGATMACVEGECVIESCDEGLGDCNGDPADGCEDPMTSTEHCGACGETCAPAHGVGDCSAGVCLIARCDDGWADCNDDATDGCEANLGSGSSCTGCGRVCSGRIDCGCVPELGGCRTLIGACFAACGPGDLFFDSDCWVETEKSACVSLTGPCSEDADCRCYADPGWGHECVTDEGESCWGSW